ncbi:DUF4145 domain-containing protein [Streptomyces albidoflavus]
MASTVCGWCGDRAHMTPLLEEPISLPMQRASWQADDPPIIYMGAFQCPNEKCQKLSIAWGAAPRPRHMSQKEAFLISETLEWEPVKVRRPPYPEVPEEIAATASEAYACFSVNGYRGAVSLARAVVEATAKAKGITERGIIGKINALHEKGVISSLTRDTSQAIRKDGNSIAHGDIGDEPISRDDAAAILEFMDALLDEVFQRPAKLERLKQRHLDRKADSAAE